MRTVAVVTVGRSDYGIFRPILRAIQQAPDLSLRLMVTGMHLSPEFGYTVEAIEEEGFHVDERIDMLLSSDRPEGTSISIGLGVVGFAHSFGRARPDILLVLGDRFEMFAAVTAALPFRIPVAHISGGEVTEGAIDDSIRHCITKLSHLHLVSTEIYATRVIRLGEEPWRVSVVGALGLDNLVSVEIDDFQSLKASLDLEFSQPYVMATYHPATLNDMTPGAQIAEVLAAIDARNVPVVFTMPNADPGGRLIWEQVKEFAANRPNVHWVENLGTQAYFSMMASSALMLGNSSSGIVEASSFGLPVVNIGNRQKGRVRGANVIDVECARGDIITGIDHALDPAFKQSVAGVVNPYGTGAAAGLIIERLRSMELGSNMTTKRFYDGPSAPSV